MFREVFGASTLFLGGRLTLVSAEWSCQIQVGDIAGRCSLHLSKKYALLQGIMNFPAWLNLISDQGQLATGQTVPAEKWATLSPLFLTLADTAFKEMSSQVDSLIQDSRMY
jgi:hypothetical protein